jgi:flagellar protein FliS
VNQPRGAAARYQKVQVGTGDPAQIVSLLFDGALRFAAEASSALREGDRARAGDRIGRAHAIVSHLAATLDRRHAPDLADNLLGIYGFCMRRLLEANLQQDAALLDEVMVALRPLREAWAQVSGRSAR